MNCFHCYYLFSQISEDSETQEFKDYFIFDEHYNIEIYRFCSLNCGLKYIMDSKTELVKKIKHFFDFYDVVPYSEKNPSGVSQALPKERLIIFGGYLDYTTYRKDFICPDMHVKSESIIDNYFKSFKDYKSPENKFSKSFASGDVDFESSIV